MDESKGNHLNIEGGQVKEDEHIATYKSIPESEFRSSKPNLSKSREKISDEAEEKLLEKEELAKITTRVDMADAKYVAGDHRNGDAKIELDANKRQFSGLTKEELMKYADDPFWVRLRWTMFMLFWTMWLCMLAAAIAIIVLAPKCPAPTPKRWFDNGPLIESPKLVVDLSSTPTVLDNLRQVGARGLLVTEPEPYKVLVEERAVDSIKNFVVKAKEYGVKIIADLKATYVSTEHEWFKRSENRSAEYDTYFIWRDGNGFDSTTNDPLPPNNWVSKSNTAAWTYSPTRKQFYYHHLDSDKPHLNFGNVDVVKRFDEVLKVYMKAGIAGVRVDGRSLLVNSTKDEPSLRTQTMDHGADHTQYTYYKHDATLDQRGIFSLLQHWAHLVATNAVGGEDTVFTVSEDGVQNELFFEKKDEDLSFLRPPSAAPLDLASRDHVQHLKSKISKWTALQLLDEGKHNLEVAAFSLLLPAAPVLPLSLFEEAPDNSTIAQWKSFSTLVSLRTDATVAHGQYKVTGAPSVTVTVGSAVNVTGESAVNVTGAPAVNVTAGADQVLVCARWKTGHTGYAAVYNRQSVAVTTDLSGVTSVPSDVTLQYASATTRRSANYTESTQRLSSDKLLVPAKSTLVLSYVPKTTAEK